MFNAATGGYAGAVLWSAGDVMKIGILGAGNIGGNLARLLGRAGHDVRLANSRGPETIRDRAREAGATPVTVGDVVRDVDLVIVSIPLGAIESLPGNLFDSVPADVIVVDTGNYYPGLRDPEIAEIEAGMPESLWVSQRLERPLVKAFNSIGFPSLAGGGRPTGSPGRIALPVAGDDPRARAAVMTLIDEIGFDIVDAGALDESWRQQPGTPAYCTDLDRGSLVSALAMADRARAPERRDRFIEEMRAAIREGRPVDLVALGRSVYGAPAPGAGPS